MYRPPETQPKGEGADVFSLGCVFSEMLTVRHGQSLEDFQVFRRVQHCEDAFAFKKNLEKVFAWLYDIIPRRYSVVTYSLSRRVKCWSLIP